MPPPTHSAAFIAALTRHQPALEAFCHAQLGHHQDARDVLQATCVKLWEKSADWNPDTPFLPWAFAVARYTALSHIRDQMRDRLIFDEDVLLTMAEETESAAAMNRSLSAVKMTLLRLREQLGTCIQRQLHTAS